MITRPALCALLLILAACGGARAEADPIGSADPSASTTIVLVRHAEKAAEPADDPPLTEAGHARAAALVDALGDARIDAIYSTQYERNRATAEPLARAAGVAVTIVDTAGDWASSSAAVADRARTEHPGGLVVIVGHSNTLGETIAALGGPDDIGELPDEAYDHFYTMLLREGEAARLIRTRFGAPTP